MKKPKKEEALRWFTHAKDEFKDADELSLLKFLPPINLTRWVFLIEE